MKPNEKHAGLSGQAAGAGSMVAPAATPDLKDPHVVLSLLETDQVVAAKQQTRFGQRSLSLGTRVLLWGLRIYVVAMLVLVVVSVVRAIHSAH
jgi:hypothetical protein